MRAPFFMDKLSPQERTTIKRWYVYGTCVYSALALLVVAMVAAKTNLMESQIAKLAVTRGAVASEPQGSPVCAARDLKLVTLIEELGEVRTVPGDKLAEVFFTMVTARDLCRAGRVAEALAVYDSIAITPTPAAGK